MRVTWICNLFARTKLVVRVSRRLTTISPPVSLSSRSTYVACKRCFYEEQVTLIESCIRKTDQKFSLLMFPLLDINILNFFEITNTKRQYIDCNIAIAKGGPLVCRKKCTRLEYTHLSIIFTKHKNPSSLEERIRNMIPKKEQAFFANSEIKVQVVH